MGMSVRVFLIVIDAGGLSPLWAASVSRQVVLGYIRMPTKDEPANKQCFSMVSASSSCFGFLQSWTVTCKLKQTPAPTYFWPECFIAAKR